MNMPSYQTKRISAALVLLALLFYVFIYTPTLTVPYQVIKEDGHFEIRKYESVVTAEYLADGNQEISLQTARDIFESYTHGNNVPTQKLKEMYPIFMQVSERSPSNPTQFLPISEQKYWYIKMPLYTKTVNEILPRPNNAKIALVTVADRTMAVLKFSGALTNENVQKHLDELAKYGEDQKLILIANPIIAVYHHAFWVPKSMQHNEMMWQILTR